MIIKLKNNKEIKTNHISFKVTSPIISHVNCELVYLNDNNEPISLFGTDIETFVITSNIPVTPEIPKDIETISIDNIPYNVIHCTVEEFETKNEYEFLSYTAVYWATINKGTIISYFSTKKPDWATHVVYFK